ncbi:transcription elongation factor GreA [SAR202 cluster bacterium AD-802-E10_MRT_200m]|nr:transcription elongation factor GreA [SAR202 cluster bacterium AD-802-E10_MRT_200m]
MPFEGTYLTAKGLSMLRDELEHLYTVRRREVAENLRTASEVGGTVDNAEYDEAKREQDTVERRIMTVEHLLKDPILIPDQLESSGEVQVGSTVTLADQEGVETEYTIVGSTEADPLHGRISNESPVGKAILGKRAGDQVEARAPGGVVNLTIRAIQ